MLPASTSTICRRASDHVLHDLAVSIPSPSPVPTPSLGFSRQSWFERPRERERERESGMVHPLALGRQPHDDATLRARARGAQAEPKSRMAAQWLRVLRLAIRDEH